MVADFLAHAQNTARAHINARTLHMADGFDTVFKIARGDNLAVEFFRCVDIVIVIIKTGFFQASGLFGR